MIRQNVLELTPEPVTNFALSARGYDTVQVCNILHEPTLLAHYGPDIPAPQAVVEADGVLAFFWPIDNWPLVIRVAKGEWSRRDPIQAG